MKPVWGCKRHTCCAIVLWGNYRETLAQAAVRSGMLPSAVCLEQGGLPGHEACRACSSDEHQYQMYQLYHFNVANPCQSRNWIELR